MRISDWSSDVCSSDLQGLPGIAGAERIAARGLPGEGAGLGTAAAELERIADGSGAGFGLSAIAATHRSEENTSELQSLMRSSYAVFCLKKTKKKLNNNMST